jgi:hypothetical protein
MERIGIVQRSYEKTGGSSESVLEDATTFKQVRPGENN